MIVHLFVFNFFFFEQFFKRWGNAVIESRNAVVGLPGRPRGEPGCVLSAAQAGGAAAPSLRGHILKE